MKPVTTALSLFVLLGLVLSGCAIQPIVTPEEVMQAPEGEAEVIGLPAVFMATALEYMAGTWMCEQDGEAKLIRFDNDGVYYEIRGANDAVAVGNFWFSDGELHVISNVDEAILEGVFQAIIEMEGDAAQLKLESCGGNCLTVAGIQWEEGFTRVEPGG